MNNTKTQSNKMSKKETILMYLIVGGAFQAFVYAMIMAN